MNLLQAVTSRKPFKRTIERTWRQPHHPHILTHEDILAEDYEVEGQPVEYPVTEAELNQAYTLGFQGASPEFKRLVANVICRGKVV